MIECTHTYADPIIDAIQPMIEAVTADAAVTAGNLYYIKANGTPTASATETIDDASVATKLWGIAIESAASGAAVRILYRGDVRNAWSVTDADRRRLSNVGVILR